MILGLSQQESAWADPEKARGTLLRVRGVVNDLYLQAVAGRVSYKRHFRCSFRCCDALPSPVGRRCFGSGLILTGYSDLCGSKPVSNLGFEPADGPSADTPAAGEVAALLLTSAR